MKLWPGCFCNQPNNIGYRQLGGSEFKVSVLTLGIGTLSGNCITAGADHSDQVGGGGFGQHHRQSPSWWNRSFKKNGPQAIGKSRGGWTTKIPLVAANARCALSFALSPGNAGDAPEGRSLL
jgi:hypothetical protein